MTQDHHVNLNIARYAMLILGIWPLKLSGTKLLLHKIYHYFTFYAYILFDFTLTLKGILLIGVDFEEFSENFGVTIVLVIIAIKVAIVTSEPIRKLIWDVEESEQKILQNPEESIRELHKKHCQSSTYVSLYLLITGTFAISLYFFDPIIYNSKYSEEIVKSNGTMKKKLIFSQWFPFDESYYYKTAYFIQLLGSFYGVGSTLTTGAFLYSIMNFCRSEIRILQHTFKNFVKFVEKYEEQNKVSRQTAETTLLKHCIKEHCKIITFVTTLEKSLKTYLFLDFAISSFQFSLLVFQILQNSNFDVEKFGVIMYLETMGIQLYLFYTNAHEIIIQSEYLSQAIFECEWYKLSTSMQKSLMIIMIRAQKPLQLSIGPFYPMRAELLLKIMRALYTYICIIMK